MDGLHYILIGVVLPTALLCARGWYRERTLRQGAERRCKNLQRSLDKAEARAVELGEHLRSTYEDMYSQDSDCLRSVIPMIKEDVIDIEPGYVVIQVESLCCRYRISKHEWSRMRTRLREFNDYRQHLRNAVAQMFTDELMKTLV